MAGETKRTLLIPGLGGSGPDHWQRRWTRERRDCVVVEQASWRDPYPDDWVGTIDAAVAATPQAVLVAHSLGCLAVAHWAVTADTANVVAALLVAPVDADVDADWSAEIARFAPVPGPALPFRSVVVASRNDPYADFARARCFAERWGSDFVDAGLVGHINADSGLGNWDFGQVLLDGLLKTADDDRHARAAALRSTARPPAPCFGP